MGLGNYHHPCLDGVFTSLGLASLGLYGSRKGVAWHRSWLLPLLWALAGVALLEGESGTARQNDLLGTLFLF